MGLARLSPTLLLGLFLWGCSPSTPPEDVVSAFWAATLTGDEATVRRLVLPASFRADQYRAARHGQVYDSVLIGPATVDDSSARIDTRLHGVFYGEADTVEFDTVATLYQGQWKIDYSATASAMIGAILQEAVTDAEESIRSESKILEGSMNDSVRQDLSQPPVATDTP